MSKLKEIEKDCLKLKRQKQLHEYGQGQLDLIKIFKEKIKQNKDKYSIDDIKNISEKSRIVVVCLMIANELHHINEELERSFKVQ